MTRWRTVTPILSPYRHSGSLRRPFRFSEGVWIGERNNWHIHADDVALWCTSRQCKGVERAQLALVAEYDADSLGDPDPSAAVRSKQALRSRQAVALERLRLANISMWLSRPSSLGFEICVHQEDDGGGVFRLRQGITYHPLLPLRYYLGAALSTQDLVRARRHFKALSTARRRGALWTSVSMLLKALVEKEWEIRFLLLWVSIEALLGPSSPGETTYRLSTRAGFLIGRNRYEAEVVSNKVKHAYGLRSKVVHGRDATLTPEQRYELLKETEEIARDALLRALSKPELVEIFSGEKRDRYLDGLPFARGRTFHQG